MEQGSESPLSPPVEIRTVDEQKVQFMKVEIGLDDIVEED
jgi:hypothetical protein